MVVTSQGKDRKFSASGDKGRLSGKLTFTMKQEFDLVVENDDKGRKVVNTDETTIMGFANGMKVDLVQTGALSGYSVAYQRKDGKMTCTLIGKKAPTDEQRRALKELEDQLADDDDTDGDLPKSKVALDTTWDTTANHLRGDLGAERLSGKLKSKFIRVEKVDGLLCAVIESKGSLKGKAPAPAAIPAEGLLDFECDITITTHRSLKYSMAVKQSITGTTKSTGKLKDKTETIEISEEGAISVETHIRVRKTP